MTRCHNDRFGTLRATPRLGESVDCGYSEELRTVVLRLFRSGAASTLGTDFRS